MISDDFVYLVLLSLALFLSLCLNVVFCIRRHTRCCRDIDGPCITHICTERSTSQEEGHDFHNLDDDEQQDNLQGQRENPIYGNIGSDRRVCTDVCYETVAIQHARDPVKPSEPDLNYASLDIKTAKKRMKKNRHRQGRDPQGGSDLRDEPPVNLTASSNASFEVETDVDAQRLSRDTGAMTSRSCLYLNSQQIV